MSVTSSKCDATPSARSERTLAIIKPEAYDDAEAIENHIQDHGFIILARRSVRLTPEQAAELYCQHYGRQHFPHLVAHMASGPIIALVLAGPDSLQRWNTLMGPARVAEAQAYWPESLRACYGRKTPHSDYFNGLHGSESHADALREIHFFFPNMIVGPIIRNWQVGNYIQKNLTPVLMPALSALAAERPDEPILWLAEYIARHNKNGPQVVSTVAVEKEDYRCHTPAVSKDSLYAK